MSDEGNTNEARREEEEEGEGVLVDDNILGVARLDRRLGGNGVEEEGGVEVVGVLHFFFA